MALPDAYVRAIRSRVDGIYRQAWREINKKCKQFAERHAKKEAELRQQVKDGKITQADFNAWMRGQVFQGEQWEAQKKQMQEALLNADRAAQDIVNGKRYEVFAKGANRAGYEMEQGTGLHTSFNLYDANTVARLARDNPDLLPPKKKVGKDRAYQWYNREINNAITQGIIQGESIPEIARRLARETGEKNSAAMLRSARTMFTGAQNAGRLEGMHQAEELGIKVKKRWMATLDDRTRDTHADLDGQEVDIDEPFVTSAGNEIMYPGDPDADPSEVWNCRCTMITVYPDYPASMQRRDNETGEIIGDIKYSEWEANKRG